MTNPLILLVDDEADFVWAIQHSLTDAGYDVLTARDGLEALSLAQRHNPSLLILDIGLPFLNGFEVCERMRQDSVLADTPIIFLSIRNTSTDQVQGLGEGGDDYLVKPIDHRILKAHIQALLRRTHTDMGQRPGGAPTSRLVVGDIVLNMKSRHARVGERAIELTPAEFDLLRFFMSHSGEVFTSLQILELVWSFPKETADPGLVRWHIKNLRGKIEANPGRPVHILTKAHHGYMLQA